VYPEPGMVAMGLIGDESVEQEVEIRAAEDEQVLLVAARSKDGLVEAEILQPVVSANQPGRIRVRVQGPVPEGPLHGVVLVETSHPTCPEVRISVFGEGLHGIRSDVREVVFGAVPFRATQKQTVVVTCDADVQVRSVRASSPSVAVEEVRREGERVIVTVRTQPDLPLGGFRGCLLLEVGSGPVRKVKLPFRGQVVVADGRPESAVVAVMR
jgi:hypothetical protein